jgi:two-component system chemotaxis response regulator CheV
MDVAESKNLLEGSMPAPSWRARTRWRSCCSRSERARLFGINVFKVREVSRTPIITKHAEHAAGVEGLISLRGNVIPVLSLISFLEPRSNRGARRTMMVTEYSKRTLGFLVHEVDRIIRVDWDKVRRPKASCRPRRASSRRSPNSTTASWCRSSTSSRSWPTPSARRWSAISALGGNVDHEQHLLRRRFGGRPRKIAEVLDKLGVRTSTPPTAMEAWSRLQAWRARRADRAPLRDEIA